MTITHSYEKLKEDINAFVAARDWTQFHAPKNLAMALSVEASELVEIFQWLTCEQSSDQKNIDLSHLEEEIGDVMIYLTMLSEKFALDPLTAAHKKMQRNIIKYPAEQYRGKADNHKE